jgi:hypothetical protein
MSKALFMPFSAASIFSGVKPLAASVVRLMAGAWAIEPWPTA